MSYTKNDYLGTECDLGGLAINDFQQMFCVRCTQPECTRSLDGLSKFDKRVRNWEENLFLNPPKMDPKDPRYTALAGKKFLTIGGAPAPQGQSAWIDPQRLEEERPVTTVSIPQATPVTKPEEARKRFLPMNTPNQGPLIIPGGPTSAPPKADPWAGKSVPSSPKENVVAPGAKIRLGGSGSGVK